MSSFEHLRNTFATLVPELSRMASGAFRYLNPEAREEAVQNTVALAWHAFHALIEKGRGDEDGIIKNTLWFSIKQTRAGRRLPTNGDTKPKCTFEYAKRGRAKFEPVELNQFVADKTPIPDVVSFRLDVPQFLASLTDRQRRMAEDLMTGTSTKECASKFGVTPGAVSQFRVRFKQLFEDYVSA